MDQSAKLGLCAANFRELGHRGKCLYGLLIYKIARLKSFADDPEFAAVEGHSHNHAKAAA